MAARLAALLLSLTSASLAPAQQIVLSPAPEAVSVTVYRDPERGGETMNPRWLNGFALITETRTVDLPAGDSVIRFEGVAGGIVPVSAIVAGLPGGVVEKNRDARLLSPAALIDGTLGRRVHIKRTSRTTGRIVESDAVIRSGPDGGVVLETPDGIEALGCSGLPEMPVYDELPPGLSDKPTLEVTTRTGAPGPARLTLSYLASGFDWQANYVVNLAKDGRTLDLFAWLTLANSNGESFVDAQTQAVAGRLNRVAAKDDPGSGDPELRLQCWPMGTTSDIPLLIAPGAADPMAYPIPIASEEIVVTAQRRDEHLMDVPLSVSAVMSARLEELGDLKLYRIPEPVTVAANAQKQIALLHKERVPFKRLYWAGLDADSSQDAAPATNLLRMKNSKKKRLGIPLPSGRVAFFEQAERGPMLVGGAELGDTAIDEEVELSVGASPFVQVSQIEGPRPADNRDYPRDYAVEIANANPYPVDVEIGLFLDDDNELVKPSRKLATKYGRPIWLARIAAKGRASLAYTLVEKVAKVRPEEDPGE